MNRILFLGMDLSGKSHTSFNTANVLGRDVRSNLFTSDRTIYNKVVNKMRTENLTDKEKLYLFGTVYQSGLDNFNHSTKEQNISLVQDNLGIVRNISYFYYMGYGVDILRHMNLYSILNNGAKANIVYDTTNNFMDIRQIENIYKKRDIENETRS